ncbi:hypothetical protein AB835_00635 [Candidatus Endobugula sertula]|uniref:Uncharacterized protein n=1 Tax=Candidatus Endobugula sertula TaxID=62101 RepID=A0A1D2QTY0_9GAMM|nr:hypothetical protein AB835_00635 [Candidatus Endobugula sertula]
MTAILTNYATEKRDNYLSLKDGAQINFNIASDTLLTVTDNYETLVADAAALDNEIADLRQQLSASSNMPADISQLNEDLRNALIAKYHLVGALADAQERLHSANLDVDHYQQDMIVFDKALTLAEAELATAETMAARHTEWTSVDVENEITIVRDNATALLADNFVADPEEAINPAEILSQATARIEADIPEVLRHHGEARATLVTDNMSASLAAKNSALNHSLTQVASHTGNHGLVIQRWAELESAEKSLKHYALTTVRQYHTAIELLQGIVDSSVLGDINNDAIHAAALAVDDDAVTTEVALHQARAAVDAKKIDVDTAIIHAVVNDVNADPHVDADVQARQAELAVLEGDLLIAETAHTQKLSTAMDLWEASVPDYIWNNLHAYHQALDVLNDVSTTVAGPLNTALTEAENALVTAMRAADDHQRLSHYLTSVTQVLTEEYDYLLSANRSITLSALRGDF